MNKLTLTDEDYKILAFQIATIYENWKHSKPEVQFWQWLKAQDAKNPTFSPLNRIRPEDNEPPKPQGNPELKAMIENIIARAKKAKSD